MATTERWAPADIRALRESLELTRSQFGRLLLGADAKRADGWVRRLEEADSADFARPSRPVMVLLDWIYAGARPPHWRSVVGEARSSPRQTAQPQGSR